MTALHAFLFGPPRMSLLKYVALAFPLAIVPSAIFYGTAREVARLLGYDLSAISAPDKAVTIGELLGSIVFAPLAETLILAGVIALFSRRSLTLAQIAFVAAIIFGCLHASFGLLWFFGTTWSFFVFSCAFLVWRSASFRNAFLAAALPHALINTTAFLLIAA